MATKYIKKASKTPETDDHKTQAAVQDILNDIAKRKEVAIKELNKKFDKYDGEVIVSKEKIEEAIKKVDQKTKDDVKFAHERIRKFAEHQLKSMNNDFEVELSKGLFAGQRLIPVDTAGCYIPGGRYAHISSAVMAITPAKVAGVKTIICASPPKDKDGANPGIIFAANHCGADVIMNLGGVAAIGSMTHGCFKNPPVDFLVGAGNQYVAEAKRIVYGKVGIDLLAGPSEIIVVANNNNNPDWVASDLIAQAEHDENAQSILITDSKDFATKVLSSIKKIKKDLSKKKIIEKSLNNNGIIALVDNIELASEIINFVAPEHLHIHISNNKKLLSNINNAGGIFLGEYSVEAFGDYIVGTNHVLPTSGAAKFSSGLGVLDFMKRTSVVDMNKKSFNALSEDTEKMSGLEGLDGHKLSVKIRQKK